jgi:DinB superfamily
MMDAHRKEWNLKQQALRQALTRLDDHQKAMELFLSQHAMVHAAEMSHAGLWSFEDEVLEGVTEQHMRLIPPNGEHSIVWMIWHMTRCEDITMNLLAAGSPQVLLRENWLERMKTNIADTGNAMTIDQVEDLSARIDLEALRAYRHSVGRRTREVAGLFLPEQLKRKVDPTRLRQIIMEGAVVEAASGLLDYWGGLTLAGLLLMPPTRHNFVHWNETMRVKKNIG